MNTNLNDYQALKSPKGPFLWVPLFCVGFAVFVLKWQDPGWPERLQRKHLQILDICKFTEAQKKEGMAHMVMEGLKRPAPMLRPETDGPANNTVKQQVLNTFQRYALCVVWWSGSGGLNIIVGFSR